MKAPSADSSASGADPTPGAHGPLELSADDVQRISRTLLLLVAKFEQITFETADSAPPPESDAFRLWRGRSPENAHDAMITMQFANLSAFDHVRAFVALIRTPTVRSTALATVARGAHESLARTWYLLDGSDDDDFLYRAISLLRSDLRIPENRNEPLRTRNGDVVIPTKKRQELSNELKRFGLPAPAKIELTALVTTMLDEAFEDGNGRDEYSTLSAVAHGHRHGLNNFVITAAGGEVAGLAAPRAAVVHFAAMLMGALHSVAWRFIAFYGPQARHADLFRTAWHRAYGSLEPVAASIWSNK